MRASVCLGVSVQKGGIAFAFSYSSVQDFSTRVFVTCSIGENKIIKNLLVFKYFNDPLSYVLELTKFLTVKITYRKWYINNVRNYNSF